LGDMGIRWWHGSQIVDKTIMEADLDKDGKISFEEFMKMVEGTDISNSMTLGLTHV
jgi:serine/threonine-protein phosphatase 2B regulatory subunit